MQPSCHSPGAQLAGFLLPSGHSTHLQLVLVLLVDASKQLGFPSVEGVDEGITLGHQAGLKLHTVLLCARAHLSGMGASGCQGEQSSPIHWWGADLC